MRVLFGSTNMLGTGVNAQQRAVAVHHLEIPWRPADREQRNGRAIRKGNTVKLWGGNVVDVVIYGTETVSYTHLHENRKAEKEVRKVNVIEFDSAFFNGRSVVVFDDVITKGLSYATYANQLESLGANVLGGISVSYTHLDVYKRQVPLYLIPTRYPVRDYGKSYRTYRKLQMCIRDRN